MPKVILNTKEEKAPFFKGMNKLADAVTNTMGFAGKQTIISKGWGAVVESTKDGYYTANNIQFHDWVEDAGAKLLKDNAKKTADYVGDNTTTVTLLTQFMINEGVKLVDAGANPRKVKEGIDTAVKFVLEYLDSISMKIESKDDKKIFDVATISANNDEIVGRLIAEAYSKIGLNGRLEIEESSKEETIIDVIAGAEIQKGFLNDAWINDKSKMIINYENPVFMVYNYDLMKLIDLEPFLRSIQSQNGGNLAAVPIVIYANDFGAEVTDSLLTNNLRGGTCFVCLKPPTSYRTENMQDICKVTGATMITIENGLTPAQANVSHVGTAKRIKSNNFTTTIIGGGGDAEKFEQHIKELKILAEDAKQPEVKEVFEKRISLISGSVGVIKVGGATPVEAKERKDRIEDAVRATKCAIEEGILVGGGKAMLSAVSELGLYSTDKDSQKGIAMILEALKQPLIKMCKNANINSSEILSQVMGSIKDNGYNFKTEKIENLIEAGVIDATKVVKNAILNASSVAGQIITSGSFIIEVPETQIGKYE